MDHIAHDQLDERICDLIPEAENPETFREFIRATENMFELRPAELDNMSESELNAYLDFMDELWFK